MSTSWTRVGAGALALGLSSMAAVPAAAQGSNNKVAAEALFEEGRKLMSAGHADQACPKFADSQRLDPSVGTLLNLASCYEATGRTASAWATFKQGASAASAANRTSDLQVAQKRAAALVPKLSRLTIVVPPGIDGLEIKRDGAVVDRAELGVAIPIDPGVHKVEAAAPKRKPWTTSVDVGKEAAAVSVTVPALENAPEEPPPPVVAPPPPAPVEPPPVVAAPPPAEPPPPPPSGWSTQRTVGVVVAGVGVVGLAVGGIFALTAKSRYNTSLDHCGADKNACDAQGVSQRDDARSAGNMATVMSAVGGAALIAGGVLFFTGGNADPPRTGFQVLPTLGGAIARGSF